MLVFIKMTKTSTTSNNRLFCVIEGSSNRFTADDSTDSTDDSNCGVLVRSHSSENRKRAIIMSSEDSSRSESNASFSDSNSDSDSTEIVSNMDIGKYIGVSVDDNTKLQLCKSAWKPPNGYPFPLHATRKIKFQMSWLEKFPWLVYSKEKEGPLCRPCVLFAQEFVGKGGTKELVI